MLSSVLKEHRAAREARKETLARRAEAVIVLADEIENNARVCVGLELNNSVSNQRYLDDAVRALQREVAALAKVTANYAAQHEALLAAVAEVGSIDPWLRYAEGSLRNTQANFEYIAKSLTADDA
jgi:adenosyl cobinamide kinase/adenosyl cobinamide phosphate guanylyltransferase